jgi:hypothetical protein
VKARVLVLVSVAVLACAAGTFLTPRSVTSSQSHPPVVTASRDAATDVDVDVDTYGNKVTNAVAEYPLDPTGSLYELHAPQIELPRLGSRKS